MIEPKLRFKANDGSQFPDWEEKNVEDICSVSTGKGNTQDKVDTGAYRFYVRSPIIEHSDSYLFDEEAVITVGDGVGTGKVFHYVKGKYNLHQRCYRMYDFRSVTGKYFYYFFSTNFYRRVKSMSAKTSVDSVRMEMITKMKISVPCLPEQQKIAEFLSTIDTVIEKQKETVSAWEERKKGVMQKLFSQEVRFKADDGSEFPDWEEKSFSDVFENLNNSTFSRDCLNYEAGNVKYIHYGDILTKFGFAIDVQSSNVPYVNDDLDCEKYASLSDGDIVIADTAEDDTVGKAVEIMNTHCGKTISGLHTIACHPKEKFASKYLGYFMNAGIYHNQLRPYMQGIKVTSVSKTNIALTKILVPCLEEQQKIADCLSSLDEVIEKQKATLAAWEELKKGLLQQMFV